MPSIRESSAQVRALAANDRDLRLVNLLKTQHGLLDHRDTSEAAVLRCPALAGRITGVSRSVEPLVRHVLISRCLPPDQSGGAHTRTSAPSARNRTASPTSGSSPRPPSVDNNTRATGAAVPLASR